MTGYWGDPELTKERMRDGWVYTRDMGSFDEDGYLTIVDRKDDMIITGGFNVWPAEIEGEIYRHPKVREAAVFGVEDRKWGEAVVAAVYARPGEQLGEQELRDYLADKIAKHKIPKTVWLRDEPLPTSAADKLLRRRTKDEYLATQVGGAEPVGS
jgi:acyl-CoA synthetase (AMP-forming)/AMP-acid ligase II